MNSRQSTTAAKYKQVTERFIKYLGRKADAGLGNLNPADIRGFRDLLHTEGRAAETVNNIVSKVLSAPLAKAVRLGYIPTNPCAAVEPLREANIEADTFTLDQVKALVTSAPSWDWKGLILAGFYTGQRLGDLAERWFAKITEQRIRRAAFKAVADLETAIRDYIEANNLNPKPFVWTSSAELILGRTERLCTRINQSGHQALVGDWSQ